MPVPTTQPYKVTPTNPFSLIFVPRLKRTGGFRAPLPVPLRSRVRSHKRPRPVLFLFPVLIRLIDDPDRLIRAQSYKVSVI